MGFSHWIPQPCIPSYQLDLWDVWTSGRLHADSLSWSSVTWWKFLVVNKFKKPGSRSIHQGDQIPLRLSLISRWKLKCWICQSLFAKINRSASNKHDLHVTTAHVKESHIVVPEGNRQCCKIWSSSRVYHWTSMTNLDPESMGLVLIKEDLQSLVHSHQKFLELINPFSWKRNVLTSHWILWGIAT